MSIFDILVTETSQAIEGCDGISPVNDFLAYKIDLKLNQNVPTSIDSSYPVTITAEDLAGTQEQWVVTLNFIPEDLNPPEFLEAYYKSNIVNPAV